MIVFGGGQFGGSIFNTLFNDVWVLTNANGVGGTPQWIPLSPAGGPPAPRAGQEVVYDAANNRMVVFGGGNNGIESVPNDVWVLTNANGLGGAPNWTQLAPSGTIPSRREHFAVGYDPATNRMVIFGGCCYWTNDTFVLTNANGLGGQPQWSQILPGGTLPSIRSTPSFGYDPAGNFLIIFGELGPNITYNDTWKLTDANGVGGTPQWTNLIPNGDPNSPPIISGLNTASASSYDPADRRLISLKNGPNASGQVVLQTWVLSIPVGSLINPGGVLNSASNAPGPVAPGSIAVAYGSFLLNSPTTASGAPWPTTLGGLSLQFGGIEAPLFYASSVQADFQVPWELLGKTQAPLTATASGQTSIAQNVMLAPFAPGIFSVNAQGTGQGAILDTSYRLVDSSNPATPGSTIIAIYCTGLGPVTNQPASGSAAPSNPLAVTTTPIVTVGGVPATVLFSGLAPGFVGEYQVNAQVPAAAPAGNAVPVVISIGGVTSNAVTIAVQPSHSSGTLQIQITGLPTGTAGSVSVTSTSGFNQTITASQALQLPLGIYSIVPNPVAVGILTYYAQAPAPVNVSAGSSTTVQVAYATAIPSATKTLDPAGLQGLTVSADASTITLPVSSSVAQSLAAGNVLAVGITTATPNGLLRKVVSVSQSGSQVVVATTQATLADAFQQLDFRFGTALNPQNLKPTMLAPGVSIRRPDRTIWLPTSASTASSAPVSCTSDTAVFVEMLGATIINDSNGSITTSGEFDICPSLEFDLNYTVLPPAINSLTATATITGDLHIDVSGQYLASFDKKVPIAYLESDPIPVDVFGVPLVMTPDITVFVGASGQATGSFSAGATQTASLTEGISYAGGQISPVQTWTHDFTIDPMALDVNLSAKIYAGLTLGLKIDEILTPQISPEAFLQLDVNPLGNPWWVLSGGVNLSGDVDVSIIGIGKDFNFPDLFQQSAPIKQAPGPILPSDETPVLNAINPNTVTAGSSDVSLTATGSNFVPGSVVNFGKTGLSTTFMSPTQLTAVLSAGLITTAGGYAVTVANPPPEAGTSQAVSFTVQSTSTQNPQPSISSLSPTSATAGSEPITVTINGSGFIATSSVTFNGVSHTASLLNANQLTITLSASDLAAPGTFSVVVTNPQPGGGSSQPASFVVQSPATPLLQRLVLTLANLTGGSSTTGTVTLAGVAPSGGVQITLSSNNSNVQVPATVSIVAGQSSATFTVATATVTSTQTATITASLGSVQLSTNLTVSPVGSPAGNNIILVAKGILISPTPLSDFGTSLSDPTSIAEVSLRLDLSSLIPSGSGLFAFGAWCNAPSAPPVGSPPDAETSGSYRGQPLLFILTSCSYTQKGGYSLLVRLGVPDLSGNITQAIFPVTIGQ